MTTVRRVLPERVPAPGSPFRRSALEPDRSRSPSILRSCRRGTGARGHDKDQRGCERREGDNRGCRAACSKPNTVGPSSLPGRPETASTPAAAGFAGPCLRPTRGRNPEIEPGRSRERRFRSSAFAVRRWHQPVPPRYSSSTVSKSLGPSSQKASATRHLLPPTFTHSPRCRTVRKLPWPTAGYGDSGRSAPVPGRAAG